MRGESVCHKHRHMPDVTVCSAFHILPIIGRKWAQVEAVLSAGASAPLLAVGVALHWWPKRLAGCGSRAAVT
jgi:hypothetical protein